MKSCKKALSLILTLLLVVSCCSTLLVSAADSYNHLPQIYVSGIGSRAVYEIGDPNKTSLFYPVNMDAFVGNLSNFPEYAKQSVEKGDPKILYNCVYSWMWDTFGLTVLDKDGFTNRFNVTIDPCNLDYEGNGKYTFNYDSRLGPVDLAHQLHEYIGWVQEHSGSKRVELVASSYGCSVAAAYLNEYPECSEYVDSVLLCVPSLGGVDFVGEVFSGSFDVNPDVVEDFVEISLGNSDLDLLLSVLNKSGALDAILQYALEPVLEIALLDAVKDVVRDIFGTFPSMWSFVQDEFFYDALARTYGGDFADPDHEYAVLIDKLIYYHENVMVRAPEIFHEASDKGIHMNIIAKYGRPSIPLSSHGNFMSDSLVAVSVASFGGTCSMYRETLPADYKQAKYPEYNMLSADGCIDASTGALPFNTWYIRGLEHAEKPDSYFKMLDDIVYNDLTVYSDPKYPQFLQIAPDGSGQLIPLQKPEEKCEPSLLEEFFALLKRVIEMLIDKIKEFFANQAPAQ